MKRLEGPSDDGYSLLHRENGRFYFFPFFKGQWVGMCAFILFFLKQNTVETEIFKMFFPKPSYCLKTKLHKMLFVCVWVGGGVTMYFPDTV